MDLGSAMPTDTSSSRKCCGSLGSSQSHRQHTGQHVVLVHDVQPQLGCRLAAQRSAVPLFSRRRRSVTTTSQLRQTRLPSTQSGPILRAGRMSSSICSQMVADNRWHDLNLLEMATNRSAKSRVSRILSNILTYALQALYIELHKLSISSL